MKVHLEKKPVMAIHRRILKKDRVVYFLVAPMPQEYAGGRSRIVYIGTTKKGARRIASSAAYRAQELLEQRGFRKFYVFVMSCKGRPGLKKTWIHLERACLAEFRSQYHEPPRCNTQGKKLRFTKKLKKLFRHDTINNHIMHFDSSNKENQLEQF